MNCWSRRSSFAPWLLACSLLAPVVSESATELNGAGEHELVFIPNEGQWESEIRFGARMGRGMLGFTPQGVTHVYTRNLIPPDQQFDLSDGIPSLAVNRFAERMVITQRFSGTVDPGEVTASDRVPQTVSFFVGTDRARWKAALPSYQTIVYSDIYPGVDIRYRQDEGRLVYDLLVSPNSDPSVVRIRYEGADSLYVDAEGNLHVVTPWGDIREERLSIYQDGETQRLAVSGRYLIFDNQTYGFEILEAHDRNRELIIDPTIVYTLDFGGTGSENGTEIAIDPSGNPVVAGYTASFSQFPLVNGIDELFNGDIDLFVTTLDKTTLLPLASTYLGGSETETPAGLVVGDDGTIFLSGTTNSPNFPLESSFDAMLADAQDGFVVALTDGGTVLSMASYFGAGNGKEWAGGLVRDDQGNIYIGASTDGSSLDYPCPYDCEKDGMTDALILKITPTGLVVSNTYLGGDVLEHVSDLEFDLSRDLLWIAGGSNSMNGFPFVGPVDSENPFGNTEAFVVALTSSLDAVQYATFLGGTLNDDAVALVVDESGLVVVAGETRSTDFPLIGAFDAVCEGKDIFLSRLNPSAGTLDFSTLIGAEGDENVTGLALDRFGGQHLTGYAPGFLNFPIEGGFPASATADTAALLLSIGANRRSLSFSTLISDGEVTRGEAIIFDANGSAYLAGVTSQTLAAGAPAGAYRDRQVFLARVDFDGDNDGVLDGADNCPSSANPTQTDTDNDGVGDVCDAELEPVTTGLPADVLYLVKADLDRDNYIDFIFSGNGDSGTLRISFGDPVDTLEPPVEYGNFTNAALAVDYVDADTLLDIVARTLDAVHILLNKGARGFDLTSIPLSTPMSLSDEGEGATAGDRVDFAQGGTPLPFWGREDAETVIYDVTNQRHESRRGLSQSTGTFPAVSIGYFDGDTKTDIICTPGMLLSGNGDGSFDSPQTLPFQFDNATKVDMNYDGTDDIMSVTGAVCAFHLNSGATFTEASEWTDPAGYVNFYRPLLSNIDLNDDRAFDFAALFADSGLDKSFFAILFGDGMGGNTLSQRFFCDALISNFAFSDFDGDNDLDVILLDATAGRLLVLINDGTGVFQETFPVSLGTGQSLLFALASSDADRDGNTDVLVGGEAGSNIILAINDADDRPISDSEMTVTALNNFDVEITNPVGLVISRLERTVAGSDYRRLDFDTDDTLDTRTFDYNLEFGTYEFVFEQVPGTNGSLTAIVGINGSQQATIFNNYSLQVGGTKRQGIGDTITFRYLFETESSISPANGIQTDTKLPTFQWQKLYETGSVGAGFQFQLDRFHDFREPIFDAVVSSTLFETPSPLGLDSVYYWRVRPADGNAEWSSTFAAYIGACCLGDRGDVNGVNNITVTDLTYLVNYLCHDGPAPVCFDASNANAEGGVTIADLVYLVNYLFNNGPAPFPCP